MYKCNHYFLNCKICDLEWVLWIRDVFVISDLDVLFAYAKVNIQELLTIYIIYLDC